MAEMVEGGKALEAVSDRQRQEKREKERERTTTMMKRRLHQVALVKGFLDFFLSLICLRFRA